MTVAKIFKKVGLSPHGPARWGTSVPEFGEGVDVVARVENATDNCKVRPLRFKSLPRKLVLDRQYERTRWLRNEPVLYIGQTSQPLRKRIRQFYVHKVGEKRPHAGGQVIKLLACDLWVYWSPTSDPVKVEKAMISAFTKQVGRGQPPFANGEPGEPKRIRCSN